MSGHARQAFVDGEAENHSDNQQTLLHNGKPDAEIHSENEDGQMSDMGQATELLNGKEQRGCRSPPCAAGPTEPNSNCDEEQQNQLIQLPNGREPRRWITETEWTRYIQEDAHCLHLRNRQPSVVSIFRVPKFLKDTKKEAYVPQRVSLGPYHHRSADTKGEAYVSGRVSLGPFHQGTAEIPPMGHHKGRAVRRMMKRFNDNRNLPIVPNNMDFADSATAKILELEKEIRDSYEENIDCDGETLARMLCLDGCFLLEVLRTVVGDELSNEAAKYYDPIFGENKLSYAAQDVRSDILMIENQIPFIVLRKLLELELNSAVDVDEKLFNLFERIVPFVNPFDNMRLDLKQWPFHHHLLGFLHAAIASPPSSSQGERVDQGKCSISIDCCIRPCILMLQGKSKAQNDTERFPHAVELRNAGIKFSPLQGGCIKHIKFDENSATILLPPISIMDHTEVVFRNLIAYEMCKPFEINYVSSYVALMDDLIDSEQDVSLLRRMRVLTNWLGSDKEVADLFNGLCKGVVVSGEDVFDNLGTKVKAHYNNEMKVQIGKLVQEHFSSPWKALGLAAAIVILLLTVLQTIFTIISTYKK